MKVLLVTGQLAQDIVRGYAKESSVETETVALKLAVAAFLTPQAIINELKNVKLAGFNMILVPGLVRGDTTEITKATEVPAFKGPRYSADLPTILDMLSDVELSTTVPACDLLREKLVEKALQEIQKTESQKEELLKKPGSMLVGDVAVGVAFPMRVLAEIVDAAFMDKDTVQQTAKRFVNVGADIIDVGMVAGESQPEKARQIVQWVKQVVDVPVSIDTLDPAEIKAAIEAGAELVLSGDAGNIEEIAAYAKNVAVVIIPTNQRQGYFPKKAQDRVKYIEEIIAKAKQLGVNRCIADLIVEPTDILESFIAFKEFAARNPHVPMFVGVSNVTELFDADSIGLNAILARLSSEVGGSILLATEKSTKAKGTVAEEVSAAKMMFLAKKRASVPKDLGIDLLFLKDKRTHEEPYDKTLEASANVVVAVDSEESATSLDAAGVFKIAIDRTDGNLVAAHYRSSDVTKPLNIVKGKTAANVYNKILALGLVSMLDHAAYLGKELAKAEVALETGKEYVQDAELFKKKEG
ncbi:MAG: dihydropteroate synthase-like protein [Candidatus Bathyarchaeota archaeon]|nr:dihydropteroate synthase-like protein [Candidatus Bathyarchaeota archaeon]